MSYKKTKLIPGKHQTEELQQATITKILTAIELSKQNHSVVLFLDPMHQVHNNENDYAWQKKGKKGTKQVPSNTGRRRLNIFGALNPVSYDVTSIITEANCDIESMKVFFSEIRKEYKDRPITVFLDNARYQRAYETQDHAKKLNITLEFLPPYSPNLNLIERLWKFTKKKCFKNKYYEDFQTFENTLTNFL